jgi:signal transduction histidine kinase
MRRLATRFLLLIVTAAVLPLVGYGFISIVSLRTGTRESVREGNRHVTMRAAREFGLYLTNAFDTLRSVGAELRGTQLQRWQQERILRNHVIDFPELREITLFDAHGRVVVTSRLAAPDVKPPAPEQVRPDGTFISPVTIDNDLLPLVTIGVRLGDEGAWLMATLSLEELWRMVDSIRIGQEGYALLVTDDRRLVAHGDPNEKRRIAGGEGVLDPPLLDLLRPEQDGFTIFRDRRGRELLATAARIEPTGWTLVVEQPTREAFAVARRLERQLTVAIFLALVISGAVGWLWAQSVIRRITVLRNATRAIAEGHFDARVQLGGQDEIRALGDAFNTMADKLVELQNRMRRQERLAMFGRVVQGLVHDLSTPVMNVGNVCKLIVRDWENRETREMFARTAERELGVINQLLEDLRHVARPKPMLRFPVEVNRTVNEVVESMRSQAEAAGLTLRAELAPEPLYIEADSFALGRVYRNLIQNAIEATPSGGLVAVVTRVVDGHAEIRICDTGKGIDSARLPTLFEDFVSTKSRGLGLGLAISKRLVEQLGGTVTVASEVDRGTTFVLRFPLTDARPESAAAVS